MYSERMASEVIEKEITELFIESLQEEKVK